MSTSNTVKLKLQLLQEPYRTQAIEAIEEQRGDAILNKYCMSLTSAIREMNWNDTIHGYDYWSEIHEDIKRRGDRSSYHVSFHPRMYDFIPLWANTGEKIERELRTKLDISENQKVQILSMCYVESIPTDKFVKDYKSGRLNDVKSKGVYTYTKNTGKQANPMLYVRDQVKILFRLIGSGSAQSKWSYQLEVAHKRYNKHIA